MKFDIVLLLAVSAVLLGSGLSQGADRQAGTCEESIEAVSEAPGYCGPNGEEPGKTLLPLQYKVTRENAAEPFRNKYWNNDKEGIYVDAVTGAPLFSSLDKFRSGTGVPSFARPLEPDNIAEKAVRKFFFFKRTEVRSRLGNSHLGYLFNDDSSPTGLRYSINSAALRFIPKEDLHKEGYGEYAKLFSCERLKTC